MRISDLQHLYFVGIGGIGMSALARYFHHLGKTVSGYDRTETRLTRALVQEGIPVHYEDRLELLSASIDLVIYTPAIPDTHQQLSHLKAAGYPVYKRAAVLGLIAQHQKAIGVAGTHGKTTTSAILTHLLREGGIDCTAFLGGIAANFESNFVAGDSEWVVMEADEFDRSFLHLHPHIGVITSMDADHLDIYGHAHALEESFEAYASQVQETLYHATGLPLTKAGPAAQLLGYGTEAEAAIQVSNIRSVPPNMYFDWKGHGQAWKDLQFSMAGIHNVHNAAVALGVAVQLGAKEADLRSALSSFRGIQRRFEWIYRSEELVYIDDYAHHPTELEAAIQAARELYPKRKLTGVFQPHLYSRTQDFATGFAQALDALDEVVLMDIYPARELPIEGVTADLIYHQMKNPNKQRCSKSELLEVLKGLELEVLMTLGAGDIGALVPDVANLLRG